MPDEKKTKELEQLEATLTPRTLAAKIMRASKIIGKVDKDGYNAHFKFKYQAWEDVVPAVRDACIQSGICLVPNFTLISSENGHTLVAMTLEVRDTETSEFINMDFIGEAKGTDDKCVQKAITSATKYAYLKLFQIPTATDDKDDPDGGMAPPEPQAPKITVSDDDKKRLKEVIEKLEPTKSWLDAMKAKHSSPPGAWGVMILEAWDKGCKATDAMDSYWETGEVPA